ncbi:MAG TPA: hypothetical protein PKC45_02780, partial [Gemmatales bacterium]|nr:hypothetical protein [Gemmatales bacterium]
MPSATAAPRTPSRTAAATEGQAPYTARPAARWLGLASALTLWAAYFPLDWGWLGWVALIPLLALADVR